MFSLNHLASRVAKRRHAGIAALAILGISTYLVLRFAVGTSEVRQQWPLWAVLFIGGIPLTADLAIKLFRREFGSDLLAGTA
jgi:hypothetical protein